MAKTTRVAAVGVALLGSLLVVQVLFDALELRSRAAVGVMRNGVVARDSILRGAHDLRPFDQVRRVRDCSGSVLSLSGATPVLEPGCHLDFEVTRDGREVRVAVFPVTWTGLGLLQTFTAPFASGLLLLGTAVVLLGLPSGRPARTAVAMLSLGLGVLQLTALDINWVHRLNRLHQAASCLIPFALAHLALTFPRPFQIVREQPRVVVPLYALGAGMFLLEQSLWSAYPDRWVLVARIVELMTLMGGLWVAGRVVTALSSPAPGSERYRARVLLYGAALALGFPAVCFLVDLAVQANLVGAVLPFSWAVVPISVGLAVGRRDLFDLDDRYRGFLLPSGATAASVFGLFLGLVLFFRLMGYERPLSEPSFSLALLLCMALLLEAGRRVVFRSLDRLLPSPEARFRRLLEQGARRDLLTGGPGAGVDFLLDYLMTELRPSFTALSHVDAEHQRLRISRSRGRLPPALRRLDVALDSVVAQRLLGDPTYVVHPDLSDRERGEWAACGLAPVEFAVPLRFGEQVLGALIIGRTRRVLSRSDVELLLLLAQVTAYGIRQTRRLEDAERALENRGRALTRAIESLERESDSRLVVEPEDRFAWVGRLAAGVAHEASKPLYVIRHHLARLERTDERDRHRIDSIKSEVRHVSQLIGDLQVYARSHTLVCEPLSIRGLLDELVAEGRHSAEVDIVGEANIETRGDPALLGTLFRSLLENACEAGARRVSVKLGRDDRGVVVLFADDGPGVPPELGDHIFEPFFSTKEAGRASGLGLAIAREIARSHGGGLELSSAERGAAFELRLPLP